MLCTFTGGAYSVLCIFFNLLPTGSEEKEVFKVGNIAILPSCQDMKAVAL